MESKSTLKRDKNGLTQEEFLASYSSDKYPKPSLTADIAVFAYDSNDIYLLLIKRGGHPFLDCWALPGGFANKNEPLESTAARELEEETGVKGLTLIPVGVFSKPGRDPRGWVVTQAYTALVERSSIKPKAADDAKESEWFKIIPINEKNFTLNREGLSIPIGSHNNNGEDIAFDHADIIYKAYQIIQTNNLTISTV